MKNKNRLVNLILVSALIIQALPALSCSFSTDTYFSFSSHPDFPLKKFAAGELGILQGSYARSYLYPAYRYLSGSPLSADEQNGIVALWQDRLTNTASGCTVDTKAWLDARKQVAGASKVDEIETEKPIGGDAGETFCNCQTPAFVTAAKTLKGLVDKFGASSQPVKDWLQAQDEVFSNCGVARWSDKPAKPTVIPTALPAAADPLLQKHRAYQIAAANFYAKNYDVARKLFEAIAGDTASPWQHIAGYLAARALIRKGTIDDSTTATLEEAQAELEKLVSQPAFASFALDISDLQSFVAAKVNPAEHLKDVAKKKITQQTAGELTKTIDILLNDKSDDRVKYADVPASLKSPEMIDWIMTMQSDDALGKAHAIEKWKQTQSLPWLVAAATLVHAKDREASAIISAAEKVQSGPARWTLLYNANRLNLVKGADGDLVRARLDKILNPAPAGMPLSTLNAFKQQRLQLAQNLDEFVRFGIQKPACVCSSGYIDQVPYDYSTQKITEETSPPLFTSEAGYVLDSQLPLSVLRQLAINTKIPANLRAHLAWESWVRAVLIGDEQAALALAPVVKPSNAIRAKLLDAYLAAPTPELRNFLASFIILQYSSAQPNIEYGPLMEDSYGDSSGWWWRKSPIETYAGDTDQSVQRTAIFTPLFLTAAQQAQAKKELAKIEKLPAGPNYLAQVVLPYAKAHPDDPRVPQALHLLVKATRYGDADDQTKIYSKQAHGLLHSRYKMNAWTKQTPYFY